MDEQQKPEKRRQYTREFKLEAVRLVTSGEKGLNQVARELGIRADMLRQWKRQAQGAPARPAPDVFPGHGTLACRRTPKFARLKTPKFAHSP